MTKIRKESLGRPARFYLPSLKLKDRHGNRSIEDVVHEFLVDKYGGYTAAGSTVYGYWTRPDGGIAYGEHRLYTVSFVGKDRIEELDAFIAHLAELMKEKCIYLETGEDAWLVYASV